MPSAVQERSSQKSGRSSRMEARADARPGAGGRSSHIEDARPGAGGRSSHIEDARPVRWPLVQESGRLSRKRTLVQPDTRDARPEEDVRPCRRRTFVQERSFVPGRERSSSQAEVDARPARQRTLVQERGRSSRKEDARPNARGSRSGAKTEGARARLLLMWQTAYLTLKREGERVFGLLEARFHSKESLEGC
ncbi:hypothetical protein LR48_Vigan05g151300 [Vigna angularis]|uniref:Uncharacterized protein n=1 Tax=Phaseolus angularis TaxID=3914 RepID=A0A0L9UMC7_PHAAN|nr:hypothetical protein LR48_Vigan05g151300 [Vigna angularis]